MLVLVCRAGTPSRRRGVLVMVAGAAVAACAGPAVMHTRAHRRARQSVRITPVGTPTEFRFEPTVLAGQANRPAHATFAHRLVPGNGRGALPHDFIIHEPGGRSWLARIGWAQVRIQVAPESQAAGESRLPAGTYEFYCSVHRRDGMVGIRIAQ
jgi:hypothetical protein